MKRMPISSGPTQGDYTRMSAWKPRPWVARALTLVVRGGPMVLSTLAGLLAARALPRPSSWSWIPWAFAVVAIAQLALRLTERSVRRFVPLTALLRFSLVFPDKAPKRFATALRSGNVEKMRREMEATARAGLPLDLNEAAITALQMIASLNDHDRGTRGHSERVRAFTEMLAEEMQLDQKFRDKLRWGALLHDMGKLMVPAEILNKPGRPTADEWAVLQRHPAEGGRILAPLADWLGDAVNAASQHHERWDGKGYPDGLAGEDISLSARIVAVADAFAVMTAARSYKKPLPLAVAREELTKNAGTQFDPVVVRAMLSVSIGKTSKVAGTLTSLANLPFVGSIISATAPTAAPTIVSSGAAMAALTASMVVPTPAASWVFDQPIPWSRRAVVEFAASISEGVSTQPMELALVDGAQLRVPVPAPATSLSSVNRSVGRKDGSLVGSALPASRVIGPADGSRASEEAGAGGDSMTSDGGSVTTFGPGESTTTVNSTVKQQPLGASTSVAGPGQTTTAATTSPTSRSTTTVDQTGAKPTTVPPATIGPQTRPSTTVLPTTVAVTTLPQTTLPPTTLPPTTLPQTTLPPTTLPPTTLPSTTLLSTTLPQTTLVAVDTTPPIIATTAVSNTGKGNGSGSGSGNAGSGNSGNGNGGKAKIK